MVVNDIVSKVEWWSSVGNCDRNINDNGKKNTTTTSTLREWQLLYRDGMTGLLSEKRKIRERVQAQRQEWCIMCNTHREGERETCYKLTRTKCSIKMYKHERRNQIMLSLIKIEDERHSHHPPLSSVRKLNISALITAARATHKYTDYKKVIHGMRLVNLIANTQPI